MVMSQQRKSTLAWAMYDWANSAFATTVMAGFFPVFFKQYWAAQLPADESTFYLGIGNAVASLFIVFTAALLGAVADYTGKRKRFLLVFMAVGATMTALLALIQKDHWAMAIGCYTAATIGFMGANIFYDALLVSLCEETKRDAVSSLGFALGYLGGGLLFSVNVAMYLWPGVFGLKNAAQAVQYSFLSVAIWWLLFSLPLMKYVSESPPFDRLDLRAAVIGGARQLLGTLNRLRAYKNTLVFLLAYWLYIDGVDTIIRMAIDFGMAIGLDQKDLIVALLMTQYIGFPAAIMFGYLAGRFGTKQGIYLGLSVYVIVVFWALRIDQSWEFFIMAGMVGLVQGGVQALSRSYYASLIPPDKSAEFFGFYNMMGKSAAVIGPLLVAVVTYQTQSHRLGILSLLILFISGWLLLAKVRSAQPSI